MTPKYTRWIQVKSKKVSSTSPNKYQVYIEVHPITQVYIQAHRYTSSEVHGHAKSTQHLSMHM